MTKPSFIKIYVEVPAAVHREVRMKALETGTTVTQYLLRRIEEHRDAAVGHGPFPSAPNQKRLALDVSREEANELKTQSAPFGNFRTMVLACLEQSGISFPLDIEFVRIAQSFGRLAAQKFGRNVDDESARAAWLFVTKMSTRYRYEDEAAYTAFFVALQGAAQDELGRSDST